MLNSYWYAELEAWRRFLLDFTVNASIVLYIVSSAVLGVYAAWYISSFIAFIRLGPPKPARLLEKMPQSMWPKVGILIPVYNDYEVLASIKSLQGIDYPNTVVVVVDDSDDEDLLHELSNASLRSRVKLVHYRRKGRKGLKAGALNDAIEYLLSVEHVDYVLILDADFEIEPGMVWKLVSLAFDHDAHVVQGYQRHRKGSDTVIGTLYRASAAGSIVNLVGRYRDGLYPIFTGSCGLISRRVFERVRFRPGSLAEDWRLTIDSSMEIPGFKILATHEAAASGAVPKTHRALWRQQVRWAAGTLSEFASTFLEILACKGLSRTAKLGYVLQGLYFTNGVWVYVNTLAPLAYYLVTGSHLRMPWPIGVYLWLLGIETLLIAGAMLEGYRYKDTVITALYAIPMIYYLALMHVAGTVKGILPGGVKWVVTSKRGEYRDLYRY